MKGAELFLGKRGAEGREELADAHGGLADEQPSDRIITPSWKNTRTGTRLSSAPRRPIAAANAAARLAVARIAGFYLMEQLLAGMHNWIPWLVGPLAATVLYLLFASLQLAIVGVRHR